MAKSVNGAFDLFFENTINIDPIDSSNGLRSRDFLYNQIEKLSDNKIFIKTVSKYSE